jgi:molybdate transport system substrate-binding protein
MSKQNNLHVFSAGAVAPPIKKCAEEFKAKFGTEFEFTVGKAENLIEEIAETKEGDLLTCGSEYILDHAQLKRLVIKETRRSLGSRTSAKAGFAEQIRENTVAYADGCGELMSFVNKKKVDAVLGWDAFKNLNMETMDRIELPKDLQVHRSTAIGVITFSKNKDLANKFIDFLVSDSGKKIYEEYGWHHLS